MWGIVVVWRTGTVIYVSAPKVEHARSREFRLQKEDIGFASTRLRSSVQRQLCYSLATDGKKKSSSLNFRTGYRCLGYEFRGRQPGGASANSVGRP